MKIKLISYDGCFPNLCSGVLTLELDGREVKFGNSEGCDYNQFWSSGGSVWFSADWSAHVESGKWILQEYNLPDELIEYANELIEIFNDNVPYGCCGGCV